MAKILTALYDLYNLMDNEWSDPRSKDWFPVSSLLNCVGFVFLYVKFVTDWGPRLMKGRKPFELNKTIMAFNIAQIAFNLYLICRGTSFMWRGQFNWWCQPADFSNSPRALEELTSTRYFFLLKFTDLLDTIFFVLRKKQSQVTFLHVYHHAGMFTITWMSVKYYPGGHGLFMGFINAIVHVVMYSYYLLTSIDSEYKKSFWWKKHITQLQILQFLINTVHLPLPVVWTECDYPKWALCIVTSQNLFMLVLFISFYNKAYLSKTDKGQTVMSSNGQKTHIE